MLQLNYYKDLIAKGNVSDFYNSWLWRKKRKQILQRDNNECQICKSKGRYSKGTTVHHIKHLKARPDLALTDSNLLTVCDTCHNDLHPEKFNNKPNVIKNKFKERW